MFTSFAVVLGVLSIFQSTNACPYLRKAGDGALDYSSVHQHRRLTQVITAPTCAARSTPVVASKVNTCTAYLGLKNDFDALIASLPTDLEKAKIFGQAIRLVFHDAGEADVTNSADTMGPDGCLSTDPDNAGLVEATSLVSTIIEPLWQKYCKWISRADFWVLFGQLAVEKSEITNYITFKYAYGRKDATTCEAGSGRLPDASRGMYDIKKVFVERMGLTLDDATALIGAHTIGHVHRDTSGYGFVGSATDLKNNGWDVTPHIFDHQFYRSLLTVNWYNELAPNEHAQWFRNNEPSIMLNSDIVLTFDANVFNGTGTLGQICGPFGLNYNSGFGCSPNFPLMPPTCNLACQFANDLCFFLDHFKVSWERMTNVGYGIPAATAGSSSTGKLGSLTTIDLRDCAFEATRPPNPAPV